MHDHVPSQWPFWLSLGGETTDACIGSRCLQIIVVAQCLIVLVEYWMIAHDWHKLEKLAENREGKQALHDLRNIFLLCGCCGYGMVIVRSLIPAWSPTLILFTLLIAVTARYIFRIKGLENIHRDAAILSRVKTAARISQENETPLETLNRVKSMLDADLERNDAARSE